MSWIFYALMPAPLNAACNFIDRFLVEKKIRDEMVLTILSGVVSFIIGLVIFLLIGHPIFKGYEIILLLLGGAIADISQYPYYKALAIDDTSRVVPLYQFIPAFVLLLSVIFLKETLSDQQLAGFILILIGGFILSLKTFSWKIFSLRRSFWLMIGASFMVAVPITIFRGVVISQSFLGCLAYELIGGGVGAAILLLYRPLKQRFFAEMKKVDFGVGRLIAANEILFFFSRLFTFYAVSLVPASLVMVLNGFQPFYVLIFGLALSIFFPKFIKEDLQKGTIFSKAIAIILIFVGVWFINR